MKKNCLIVSLLLTFLFSAVNLYAASWDIDKAHSGIYFRINHIFSQVQGDFGDFSGSFTFDPQDLAASRISFEIKVDSIDTNIAKRDKHLLSPDFFNARKYPQMKFTSSAITKITLLRLLEPSPSRGKATTLFFPYN